MMNPYHEAHRIARWLLLVMLLVALGIVGVRVLHSHEQLPACTGALAIGLGGHLLFDIAGYVAVFLVGIKARKYLPTCTHGHKHG